MRGRALDAGNHNKAYQQNVHPSASEVMAFAEWLVDSTFKCQTEIVSKPGFQKSPDFYHRHFAEQACIRRMLYPERLHQSFAFLAKVPSDALQSVTALYECLHFLCSRVCPEALWKVELLLTGFMLPNVLARLYHTQAVKLTLANFARLVLCRRYPQVVAGL